MSDILETILGSKEKMRLMRFFLQNPEGEYGIAEIAQRNMLVARRMKKELNSLAKIKFVLAKKKKGQTCYSLNQSFVFYPELKNLIAKDNLFPQSKSLDKVQGIGNVRLAVISGAFINYHKSKADMILVVDDLKRTKLKSLMNNLEAEIGKEVDFALMNYEEFKYRLNMLDKFILDFLEGPHEEIVNKISGLKRFISNRK